MSADLLRRAAREMRRRAEAATPGPWEPVQPSTPLGYLDIASVGDADVAWQAAPANAEHITSWHPAVALAVADWLDAVAEAWPVSDPDYWSTVRAEAIGHRQALTAARAFLGGA